MIRPLMVMLTLGCAPRGADAFCESLDRECASEGAALAGSQLRAFGERLGRAPLAELAGGVWPPRDPEDALLAAAKRLDAKLEEARAALERLPSSPSCPSARESTDPRFARRYFVSSPDDCGDDSKVAELFDRYYRARRRRIVLAIDNGAELGRNGLLVAKSVAVEVLNAASYASVTIVAADGVGPAPADCDPTKRNVEALVEYVDRLEPTDGRPEAIGRAIRRFAHESFEDGGDATVVYVGLSENEALYEAVAELAANANCSVVVNSCFVGESFNGSESPSREDGTNVRRGNVAYYDPSSGPISPALLRAPVRDVAEPAMRAAEPAWDAYGRALVPFVLPIPGRGLAVVESYFSDLVRDVSYFDRQDDERRAFVLDLSGRVLTHSSYARPEVLSRRPRFVDVSLLEVEPEFEAARSSMLRDASGKVAIKNYTYSWRRVGGVYVFCVVYESDDVAAGRSNYTRRVIDRSIRELRYHRIDLWPPSDGELCRHFAQISTVDAGALYLSPSSFQSPFAYLHDIKYESERAFKILQSCMAYLKDTSRLLSNPGLKREIRNDVGLLYPMLNYYKRQHARGEYKKYVVRRYAATDHGVLVMFPGSVLESDYEPNRKSWFMTAVRNPGKIILSQPHLDVGGAGYVITVSYAPKNELKSSIVAAMDVTSGFLRKIVVEASRVCAAPNVKCFLMDERGYLLSHPNLFDRRKTGPIEQQHVTHKESIIAIDLLNHREFVEKKLCKNFADGTLQRFYAFNSSSEDVITNIIGGEHCARYYVAAIRGTNAFFGMINASCDMGAFCACNVVDRLCLICNRMEQNECECPCECALPELSSCNSTSTPAPLCELQPEKSDRKNHFFYDSASHLKPCFDFECDTYRSESSCRGVLGCEWCHLDSDGESSISTPFCSAQSSCFGGILGAVTPYGEGSLGRVVQDDILATYSAVGPIAGCIVAVCLILALAVYCYKQNLSISNGDEVYVGDAWPDGAVQMSRLPSEDEVRDDLSGHQEKLLIANDLVVVPISPYRVLTGCKRPNAESDHGYSTMTPHDDSEHLAFGLVSTEGNSSSDLSLRTNLVEPITVLPCGRNNVIAPVTVHRNMEAT